MVTPESECRIHSASGSERELLWHHSSVLTLFGGVLFVHSGDPADDGARAGYCTGFLGSAKPTSTAHYSASPGVLGFKTGHPVP